MEFVIPAGTIDRVFRSDKGTWVLDVSENGLPSKLSFTSKALDFSGLQQGSIYRLNGVVEGTSYEGRPGLRLSALNAVVLVTAEQIQRAAAQAVAKAAS